MKSPFVLGFVLLYASTLYFSPAAFSAAADPAQTFEEQQDDLVSATQYGKQLLAKQEPSKSKGENRWSLNGRVGYVYDDNVPQASDNKTFRSSGENMSAGRYLTENAFGYDVYRGDKTRVNTAYTFYQSLHDDGLNNFNFENHDFAVQLHRKLDVGPRPSEATLEYAFSYGFLKAQTFSSFNTLTARWNGSWSDSWPVQVYQASSIRNYRDHGFRPSDTSRDGYYSRTGFIQQYKVKPLRGIVYAGYELAFDATDGNNFDNIANGLQTGWRSPLIEKVRLDLSAFFQDSAYNRYSGSPDRLDFTTQYETRLSRPFGHNFELQVFYCRTDNNTAHDGPQGLFNYNRNLYGVEWHYSF